MERASYVDDETGKLHRLQDMPPAPVLLRGTCKYCGCQDETPCAGGCAWQDPDETLCTTCAGAEGIAEQMVGVFAQLAEQATARVRLISAPWGDLTLAEKRPLVLTCREVVALVSEQLYASVDENTTLAFLELGAIADFMKETCPEEEVPDEPLSGAVIRLLAPHVGARIVRP